MRHRRAVLLALLGGVLVAGVFADTTAKPTAAALARHEELRTQLQGILTRLGAVLNQDLEAFNKTVVDAGIPPVVVLPLDKRH